MALALDPDRALEYEIQDKLGFTNIAKQLASSIVESSKGNGMVIGLEGRWGSGKTSLLNFLRTELDAFQEEEIHTITIAPWLSGDNSSMVESLLEPMMTILNAKKEAIATDNGEQGNMTREQIAKAIQLLKDYGPKTARGVASIVNVADLFIPIPGLQMATKVLKNTVNAADTLMPVESTPSELKQKIEKMIYELDIGFVVILDDLDRLEPEQAVEVVRLVRSVADFPRVTYLMCYDRKVLAHALKTGLKVADGDLFLQKIVQLTFNIPLPEPFELRIQFRDEAKTIYAEVMGIDANDKLFEDLYLAVDQEGARLSLPREVKLALNNIRFIFPQVKDNVYFPDLCRLHLIKITNFKLYQWLEEYLSLYSVLITENGEILNDKRIEMGKKLKKLLPSQDQISNCSIWNLIQFIPGLDDEKEPEKCVFNKDQDVVIEFISLKRLGSPHHYRFYFALTGPKSVMPDEKFNDLLELARTNVNQLTARFEEEVNICSESSKMWFEHVLDRLDDRCISNLDQDQLIGIIRALSGMMDIAMEKDDKQSMSSYSIDRFANKIAKSCLKRLYKLNPDKQTETVQQMAKNGEAINWLIGRFFRDQLFQHGIVGDQEESPEQWEISEKDLDNTINILKERVNKDDIKSQIHNLPKISIYLYGWMNITGDENQVIDWVKEYSTSNEGFLKILNHLREWMIHNGKVFYPLFKKNVERFFDWDETTSRLDNLKDGELADEVKEIQLAIEQSRD